MSLRASLSIIFLALLSTVGGALYVIKLTVENQKNIAAAEIRRFKSYKLADELRQSSDDLTRMARMFVNTGEERFKNYFEQIQAIRDGEMPRPLKYGDIYWDFITATGRKPRSDGEPVALESLMREMHFTNDDFELLRQSKSRSDNLIHFEERAMNAMVGLFADANGNYVVKGEPDSGLARSLMHSEEYHRAKADIMEPIEEFFISIDTRTGAEVLRLQRRGKRLNTLVITVMSVAAVLISVSFLLVQKRTFSMPAQPTEGLEIDREGFLGKISQSPAPALIRTAWPTFMAGIVACMAILGVTWWAQLKLKDNVKLRMGHTLHAVSHSTMRTAEAWLQELESETRIWANHPTLRNWLGEWQKIGVGQAQHIPPETEIVKTLVEPIFYHGGYKAYFILSPKGKVIASDNDRLNGTNITTDLPENFLENVFSPPFFSFISLPKNSAGAGEGKEVRYANSSYAAEILSGAAVRNKEGTILGALVFLVTPEQEFTAIIQRGQMGESGNSYSFNRLGQLISRSHFEDQLRQIGLLDEHENSILNIEVRNPGGNMLAGHKPDAPAKQWAYTLMARNATSGGEGTNLDGYNDYRGVPVIGAWDWNEHFGFGVATEIDVQEAYASLHGYQRQAIAATSLAMALILGLSCGFVWNRLKIAAANEKLNIAYRLIKKRKDQMEEELNIGREIQMSMIPLTFPAFPDRKEFSIYAMLQPAREVGGDFYDFYFLDDYKICFCIGDVSGKGVPAALFMAVTKTLIKSRSLHDHSTASIITHVNEALSRDNKSCVFVTLFVAILDINTGEIIYTNAGHNPPFMRRKDGSIERMEKRHGPVVGAVEELVYTEATTKMEPKDFIFLYTDGVSEAIDHNEEFYSEKRIIEAISEHPGISAEETVRAVVNSVNKFEEEAFQSDDITVLGLEYFGPDNQANLKKFETTLKNRKEDIEKLKLRFNEFADQNGIPPGDCRKIDIVIDELLVNIISYAFKDEDLHDIDVEFEMKDRDLHMVFADNGLPFNPLTAKSPDIHQNLEERDIGGLGIHLVRNLVNDITYHRSKERNVLKLVKKIS